jgi:hypothetical protein
LKALAAAPDNATAHMWLSFVKINSNQALPTPSAPWRSIGICLELWLPWALPS